MRCLKKKKFEFDFLVEARALPLLTKRSVFDSLFSG